MTNWKIGGITLLSVVGPGLGVRVPPKPDPPFSPIRLSFSIFTLLQELEENDFREKKASEKEDWPHGEKVFVGNLDWDYEKSTNT
ncbi:hypothetical protein U1Q18_034195 [Sarracenia purpurea var. burkii]